MIFSHQKLSDLREKDIRRLVDDRSQEQDTLEYKSAMYGNADDDKKEMLKDIVSLANHRGGHLIIGIEEDEDGTAKNVAGIEPDNYVERIRGSCLANIDKRIVGLDIEDIPLENGRVVIVIYVPESINGPHMVTHKGLNQFWKRHGRQKIKMTIDEIGSAYDRQLHALNRLDRFLFSRKAQILENIGSRTYMIIACSPAYLKAEAVFDIHDKALRGMIADPSSLVAGNYGNIFCGVPYPTINGLRADQHTPYEIDNPSFDRYIEVFSNGYIEFGKWMGAVSEQDRYFASEADTLLIVNFMGFVEGIYDRYLPSIPIAVNFAMFNCRGVWLAVSRRSQDQNVKWQQQHLEWGAVYAEDINKERKMVTKKICDRLWQAFNRDRCSLFDDLGTFRIRQ